MLFGVVALEVFDKEDDDDGDDDGDEDDGEYETDGLDTDNGEERIVCVELMILFVLFLMIFKFNLALVCDDSVRLTLLVEFCVQFDSSECSWQMLNNGNVTVAGADDLLFVIVLVVRFVSF